MYRVAQHTLLEALVGVCRIAMIGRICYFTFPSGSGGNVEAFRPLLAQVLRKTGVLGFW